jgi:hypothetical protein
VGIGRAPRLLLAIAATSSLLAGCGSSTTHGGGGTAGREGPPPAAPGPAETALSYEEALFSGRFEAALALVVPSARNTLRDSLLDMSASAVHQSGLFAIATVRRAHVAAVTLAGVVCTTSSQLSFIGPTTHPRRGRCVTNRRARASSPLFVVKLVKTRRGRWLVRPTA